MKTKIIEMYRPSQYKSWEEAHKMGGVYSVELPEDTPDRTIEWLIYAASNCMSANDPVTWRVRLPELTAFQKAFMKAYSEKVSDATPEQVETYLRNPNERPLGWTMSEYSRLNDHYHMFVAGWRSKYSNEK